MFQVDFSFNRLINRSRRIDVLDHFFRFSKDFGICQVDFIENNHVTACDLSAWHIRIYSQLKLCEFTVSFHRSSVYRQHDPLAFAIRFRWLQSSDEVKCLLSSQRPRQRRRQHRPIRYQLNLSHILRYARTLTRSVLYSRDFNTICFLGKQIKTYLDLQDPLFPEGYSRKLLSVALVSR